ncbi:MAG: helix-turn-helix transcriptional regulator [Oceanospirillaceae bacterium]|nr:helix-turn-helix transcriptional regulator [Oceanospirillaceae bacterium]
MNTKEKNFSRKSAPQQSARMVENIFRCKWSLTVYQLLEEGIVRPGQMVRSVEGLSTKVLNECLRKNIEFGIIERIEYNEVPPRVEYITTDFGKKFITILDQLRNLQMEMQQQPEPGEK